MFIASSGLQLHRRMTGRHTPSILQNLRGTPENYLVLIALVLIKQASTLTVGTQQVE
jgi:hypothetical protein